MTVPLKKITLIFLCAYFLGCSSVQEESIHNKEQAQSSKNAHPGNDDSFRHLTLQLKESDSILLVSHKQTYGAIFDQDKKSYVEATKIVENGIINRDVIEKTVLIEKQEKEALINILTQEVAGEPIDIATCFDPRHALIVISTSRIGYIEFCFTCGGIAAENIDILGDNFDKQKWAKIYNYIQSRIPYKE